MNIRKKDLKDIVRSKYNQIAKNSDQNKTTSCCGETSCCDKVDYTVFSDDYTNIDGYNSDADLGLGCGLPTEHANIRSGQTVLDLGSGAGNDCFVARALVGEKGKVIGIDFADEMLDKANKNVLKLGYNNVEFIKSDIEDIQLPDNTIDVVISNCVLNLVPDKKKAFREIFRVLIPGGHFCVSDVVVTGDLPEEIKDDAEMYAGCVSGAIPKDLYITHIQEQGFKNIEVKKDKKIDLPDSVLAKYLDPGSLKAFKGSETGIYSITVTGEK